MTHSSDLTRPDSAAPGSSSEAIEALRLSEAKFAGIVDIAVDAIVSVDPDQRIILFNKGAEEIFGYSSEEVLGEPLDLLLPERAREAHGRHIEEFAASPIRARRMGERQEISGRRKDGEEFPAEASISRIEVGGEKIFTAVLRDVTEERRGELALARFAEELARSNAELEQFAYVASHDLQEPLRMVASYTQLLARRYRGRLDEDADEFIDYALDGVNRMRELINDLLAYSRVGSGRADLERFDLEALLERTVQDLGPTIEESGGAVTHADLPTLVADESQIAQLLQNLIGNALKFRADDPPRVHLSAKRREDEWEISVSDNGIGIDPGHLDRIFVIFQRLHSRKAFPGTGIGLAISRKIVEGHGGRIWVESEPGRGSTFRFTIPDHDPGS